MEDGAPVKRRGKYGLRDRTYRRVSDGISDTEFEEMTKRPETDSDSPSPDPGYPQPQSSQRAPVAHMMVDMDLESPDDLTSRHDESSMASRTQAETVPKAKSSGSSQMPPPSRVPKKKTSPKQKHPKSHKVILKIKKGSTASSSTSASTHAKAGPTTNYKRPSVEDVIQATTSAVSPSSRVDSEATGSMSKDLYQADGPLGATSATKQPKSLPSGLQPKPKGRPPGTKQTTSRRAPQSSTSQYTGIENNLPSPSPTRNSSTQQPSIKGKSSSSSTEATSKQRAKPQMQMNFFIITREPRDESIYWREGKIQGTSLTDFIAGVEKATQRDGIERLDLTLKTSTLEAKVPVVKDDEASWLVAKQHFAERLKAAILKAKAKGLDESANPQIYVEPFYGMNSDVGEQEAEEDEDEEVSFLFS
ncbi:hypothetical protein L207DRAFT_575867 [Hyaloscypha variabilis F]|uniref:Uncharacterized protein n=1 Tax=Hyaloscypha variabilis (strain UAMH 11265 / GT02V1 / F) TaxID=1149755 RepID=A0A2J6S8G3_HYAVF|nr:hypothetical protein L207DRAFT_575867 [Hyaloscypha variabilis F]